MKNKTILIILFLISFPFSSNAEQNKRDKHKKDDFFDVKCVEDFTYITKTNGKSDILWRWSCHWINKTPSKGYLYVGVNPKWMRRDRPPKCNETLKIWEKARVSRHSRFTLETEDAGFWWVPGRSLTSKDVDECQKKDLAHQGFY